ncbi:hypothetical protein HOY80DRAFT_1058746 [Tuber brumale]|nr:hypothetical protein HOY80DRAFT_1058746 [Tuber brumale]
MRGASPATTATANTGFTGNDPEKVIEFTQHAMACPSTMEVLIGTISSGYRGIVAPVLRNTRDLKGKLNATYKHYDNSFSSIQPPNESRSALSSTLSEANIWFAKQKDEALKRVTALKELEVAHLEKLCSPSNLEDQIIRTPHTDWEATLRGLGHYSGKGEGLLGSIASGKSNPKIL